MAGSRGRGRRAELEAIAARYQTAGDFDEVLAGFNWRLLEPRLRGKDVLEVGCADGAISRRLAEVAGRLDILDASRAYLDALEAELGARARYHHGLAEEYRPDRLVDAVVATRLLEHLPHPVRFLREAATWLRRRGRLHLVVPNAGSFHRRLGVAMGMLARPDALSERDVKFGHHRVYDRTLLVRHVEQAGLRVVDVQGCFLKPLSNSQMLAFPPEVIEGLFTLGAELPDWCAELYLCAAPA